MIRTSLVVAAALLAPSVSRADSKFHDKTVAVPPQDLSDRPLLRDAPFAGTTLYVNRCKGGCTLKPGPDSAPDNTSQLVSAQTTLAEYAFTDPQWNDIMTCVKQVYSPYGVIITDQQPTGLYNAIYVAGHPQDIGEDAGVGGVSPVTTDCSPIHGGVAFAFAYNGQDFANEDDGNFTWGMCWIIAQETAHTFGLDHEYAFVDSGRSACNDPMTYRDDCGGEKFFRNANASCGEFGPARPGCGPANTCGSEQNSHTKLLAVLGPGTVTTTPPVQTLETPMNGATVKGGTAVIGYGQAQRGVQTVELWINGYKWSNIDGAEFNGAGQPRTPYTLPIPNEVPDSKLDIVLKAFDDIGVEGDSPTVTVTKGKAGGCDASVQNADGTVDTCLAGQQCTDGKCAWTDANMGVFGDACTYQQFCTGTLECAGSDTQKICTHSCDTGIADTCPADFDCAGTGNGTSGVCFIPAADGGGCCSVGASGVPATMISLATLAIVLRRRKRA
jgi:hypothetical protein